MLFIKISKQLQSIVHDNLTPWVQCHACWPRVVTWGIERSKNKADVDLCLGPRPSPLSQRSPFSSSSLPWNVFHPPGLWRCCILSEAPQPFAPNPWQSPLPLGKTVVILSSVLPWELLNCIYGFLSVLIPGSPVCAYPFQTMSFLKWDSTQPDCVCGCVCSLAMPAHSMWEFLGQGSN